MTVWPDFDSLAASADCKTAPGRLAFEAGLLLHLSRDAHAINAVVNDPDVRPFVGLPDAGFLDITPLVERGEHLFPFGEHGGFALLWSGPGAREVHTFIRKSGRGRWARDAARDGIALAVENGTTLLWTRIPDDQPNVRAYAVWMGMKPTGEVFEYFGKNCAIYAMGCGSCQ